MYCMIGFRSEKLETEECKCLNERNPVFIVRRFRSKQVNYNLQICDLLHLIDNTGTLRYGNGSLPLSFFPFAFNTLVNYCVQ